MPTPPPSRRPSKAHLLELERQIRGLLARCEDPAVEGCWIDLIGRKEHYINAALCRREAGLPPLEGRRTLSADQDVEPDWEAIKRARLER